MRIVEFRLIKEGVFCYMKRKSKLSVHCVPIGGGFVERKGKESSLKKYQKKGLCIIKIMPISINTHGLYEFV